MITKEIKELHFDDYKEREEFMEMYKHMGWKILHFSVVEGWYFKCSRDFKNK